MKRTRLASFLLSILTVAIACAPLQAQLRITEPTVEYLTNPIGIDVTEPRLSWKLISDERNTMQSRYRILVGSTPELLSEGVGDLWDSGQVSSDASIHIAYEGKPLASRQVAYWKVQVWDQAGQASLWSEPAMWSMGLLDASDWQAEWIGYDAIPQAPKQTDAKVAAANITIVKAIYGVSGQVDLQIDVSKKIQKLVSQGIYHFSVDNDFAGSDPAYRKRKVLELSYEINDVSRTFTLNEGAKFDLLKAESRDLGEKSYLPSPYLRKEFAASSEVERAVIYASAEGIFEMHLNGQRIGDEYFMPGWTDYNKRIYYRAYDVTDLIRQGDNALAGILGDGWFRGNISKLGQNQYGKKLRLLAQLHIDYVDGGSDVVATDASWKASFGPILESDMQAGEVYDARLEMAGWNEAGFDDSAWTPVNLSAQLSPVVQAYPGVPVRATRELATVGMTKVEEGRFIFDLGQNFAGWARLKVQGERGDTIVMRFGEMLNQDGTLHTQNLRSARATDTYILKGDGVEIYEPHFTFHGFQYVEVSGLRGAPSPDMITGIVVHSDAPLTSSFESSNPMLNQLHSNIIWGQLSNYLEVPTDCPQRDERLGWTGDTQVFMRSGTYHQNVGAFFTKWMVDLMDSVNREGIFGKQAPVFHGHGSPGWSDAGVICPWTMYQVYGDKRMLEQHYAVMARFVAAVETRGLGGMGRGFGDWLAVGSRTPKDVISVAYFAYISHLMADIAQTLGKDAEAQKYTELFERIRQHFQDSFVDAEGKIKGDSQTAYCMALTYDLLTDVQREQAAAHLVRRIEAKDYHLSVGFLGVQILLPTLTDIGRSDLAYRLLQNTTYPSWGYSVEQGATTIWERWNSYTKEGGINGEKMNSFNHYAYGACSEWMFYDMLGIDTAGIAYKEIKMKPHFGHGVEWAKGHYDSIHGRIASTWKYENGSFQWRIEVPANTTATVYVPAKSINDVTEGGVSIAKVEGIETLGIEGDRLVLKLGSGQYEFFSKIK